MVFSHFDPLRSLKDSGGYDWLIKVRVLSIWRAINIENGEVRGINILVIDDSNTRVVCFAGKQDYLSVEKLLFCGRIYRISNFSVKKYHDDPYPCPVRNDCRIFFSNYTHFEEDCINDTLIPYLGFDLHKLSDVEKLSCQNLYLSDVVGIIEVVKPCYSFMNKNKISQSFVPFFISNGSFSAKVIFWDHFGDMLLEELEQLKTKPAIISIMCCKAQNRTGDLYFSSNPATKFYLNCDHYTVRLLRKKINDGLVHINSTAKHYNVQPAVHKISDLASVPPNLRKVTVYARFVSVRKDQCWYEHVCTTCYKTVSSEGRRFRCTECDRHVPFPDKRFRLECIAVDETGQVKVLVVDREVRKIISKSVFKVEGDLPAETVVQKLQTNGIPTALNAILDKLFALTLSIPVFVDPLEGMVCRCLSLDDVPVPAQVVSSQKSSPTAGNFEESSDASPLSTVCSTPLTGHSSSKERDTITANESAGSQPFYSYTNDHHIKLINLLSLNALRPSEIKPQMLLKCFGQIVSVDDNNVTMQAFVGESCFLKFIDLLVVGKVFIISNFTVKPVSERDRNLLTHNDRQIFFTTYTTVEDVDDILSLIPMNAFDFYDIGELETRQKQDIYLTDVIGVMEDYRPIRRWTSKRDNQTNKAIVKFSLTDGIASVQVSLWDDFAERFNSALTTDMEEPYVVIVAAAKIIITREVLEVATARPTLIFINYNYPTVHHIRKMV